MQASRRGGKIVLHVDDDKGRARQVDPDILRRGRKVDGTNRRHHAHEIGMRFIDMPSVGGELPKDAAMSCGNPGQDAQVVGIEFEPLACADQFGEPFVGHHEGQGVELSGPVLKIRCSVPGRSMSASPLPMGCSTPSHRALPVPDRT
jgi:hypothetical protein